MKLSIIVPVYNVEAFLRPCVDSLLDQDIPLSDYEVILVDDGSTDSGGMLCDDYVANHQNIRVIHQPNRGLSVARNTGIASAKGEFIQFVDSDDYLNPNVLEGIVHQMETKELDILRINYQNVNSAGIPFEPNKHSKPFVDYSEEVCDGLTFLNMRLGYACYAVQFVIRSSLLKQEGNGFKAGIHYEDVEWAPRLLLQADRVASSPTIVYNYRFRQDSITRQMDLEKRRKNLEDKIGLVRILHHQGDGLSDRRWFKGMVSQTVLSVIQEVGRHFYPERRHFIRLLKRLEVFPLSTYHATSTAAKKIRMINVSPCLSCFVFHWLY